MAPAFPPGLGGSLPSAYQFVRDPQSGQLVVIPSDHLPHFGKWWPWGGGQGVQEPHPVRLPLVPGVSCSEGSTRQDVREVEGLRGDGLQDAVSTCDKATGVVGGDEL